MNTTTLSGNDKTNPDRNHAEDHNTPLKNNDYLMKVIRRRTYRATLEIMKSVFILFPFLLAYKVIGVHDLWMQLVEKYF
jgi:hypothetical protein